MSHSNHSPKGKILVCGSINMDLVVRTPTLPTPGETLIAHRLDEVSGGKGANQAVAVARLGGRVGMLAALGSDGFGATLRANLQQEGVDLEWIVNKPGPSGVAIVAVDDQSENAIMVISGAIGQLKNPKDQEGCPDRKSPRNGPPQASRTNRTWLELCDRKIMDRLKKHTHRLSGGIPLTQLSLLSRLGEIL